MSRDERTDDHTDEYTGEQVTMAPLLSVEQVSKSFAGNRVLTEVSFEVERGEVLALVGENGAGKSTVLSLVTGLLAPDSGRVVYDGAPVRAWSPHRARAAGIGSVQQELSLNPHQSVAENVFLGAWPSRRGLVRARDLAARARPLLERVGLDVDPRTRAGRLPLGRQQLVELAKALAGEPRLLILDEATSALDEDQVGAVFRVVRELRDQGGSVIFVSHRMAELFAVSDRLTVLKDGAVMATRERDRTDHDDIVRLMVGRELSDLFPEKASGDGDGDEAGEGDVKRDGPVGPVEPVLSVRGLTVPGACSGVDLDLAPGRILGLGGLQGQGQREVLRALFGLARHTGRSTLDGRPVRLSSPRDAIRHRIAYVPEDRKTEGVHTARSVRHNLALPSLRTLAPANRLTTVSRTAEARLVAELIDRLRIKASSPAQEARRLSGGNQQKVALAKWLPTEPRVLLLAEPTRGIDIGTKREIYHLLRRLADDGLAVLVTSGDTMELVGLCDEVAVLYEGTVVDRLMGPALTEERLVRASVMGTATGIREPAAGPTTPGPETAAPTETAPTETAPAETAPAETAPAETAPAETAPAETAPAETAPVVTASAEAVPVETPAETAGMTNHAETPVMTNHAETPVITTPAETAPAEAPPSVAAPVETATSVAAPVETATSVAVPVVNPGQEPAIDETDRPDPSGSVAHA
ncbi:sugar ABC transporter ATP-binding protein [Streptomyces cavernae]|uniref:sugar ABC transporter ATP-binding protein n=1 Tax=Streptomyces cavernae TaxID=2259034 RepID=UPI000FEC0D46|nr:sugar ABC transporter ATP-binding protein [Streptomyces cavernae]